MYYHLLFMHFVASNVKWDVAKPDTDGLTTSLV